MELASLGWGSKVGIQPASIIGFAPQTKGWLSRDRLAALSEGMNLLHQRDLDYDFKSSTPELSWIILLSERKIDNPELIQTGNTNPEAIIQAAY